MPLIEIHMLKGRTDKQQKKLMEAVTEAVHKSIQAPLPTIRVWIHEFSPREYMIAGKLKADE